MKRVVRVCILFVVAAFLAVAGYFAAHKLYSMYQNAWDRLDYISESVDLIKEKVQEMAAKEEDLFYGDGFSGDDAIHEDFDYSWVNSVPPYIAHACGAIDGKTYTNSREAFLLNYERGHRVFEVDFNISKDGVLIASHDEEDWRQMTETDLPYTSENFNQLLIYDQYESLNCAEVIDLMAEYSDIYLVTDTKDQTQESVVMAFSQLVYCAKQTHPEVLDRIIPQIYNEKMLSWISDIYPFKSVIFTLYAIEWDPVSVLEFCEDSGVRFITIHEGFVSEELLRYWDTADIQVAAHTINDNQRVDELFDMGVDMIYTDFVVPN